ncbi:MAG: acyl carrier protein [bacterium]
MTSTTRDIVVAALHKSIGLLNDPIHAPQILAGHDLEFSEIELDSLDLFEVIMEIEDRMGLELDADDVAAQPSLHALVAFLNAAQGASPET